MIRRQAARAAGPFFVIVSGAIWWGGSLPGWLLGVLAAIGVMAAAWSAWDYVHASRRRNEYEAFAHQHGWQFRERTAAYNTRFRHFPFGEGTVAWQESVLSGEYGGVGCASFAHVFDTRTESDNRMVPQAYQITLAELPVVLPRIDLLPRSVGAGVAAAIAGPRISFESHEFNQRWQVISDDARYAHAVIDPRMIERLLWHDAENLTVRIEGGAVYVWAPGRRGVDDLSRRLAVVCGVARRIPAHVIREYTERGHIAHHGDAATRPLTGPAWATEPGALTSRRYTGVGVDADGDGIEDWKQLPRPTAETS